MLKKVIFINLLMALVAAAVYILMANNIILPESLKSGEPLPPYFYIVPAGYIIGGLLILLKKRWLWITGAVINAFGITMFYIAYANQTDIMLSAAGLITKSAQILMEIGLIYLIITYKKEGLKAKSSPASGGR